MSRHFNLNFVNRQRQLQTQRNRQWMQHWLDDQHAPCKDQDKDDKRRLKELGV